MEFTGDGIRLDKPTNTLDDLVLGVVGVFDDHVDYAVVSGYVVVLLGRSRATGNIGVIVERFDAETATMLAA